MKLRLKQCRPCKGTGKLRVKVKYLCGIKNILKGKCCFCNGDGWRGVEK